MSRLRMIMILREVCFVAMVLTTVTLASVATTVLYAELHPPIVIDNPEHISLMREVTATVLRPAYRDADMKKEMPLSEIYTPYEMDLFNRLAIAAGYTQEQFESSDFDTTR